MKIRSVQLTNFRKFVGTFAVDGIANGVNVLVGQNELGKSTLLAAINGVIFEKAKSQTEKVKSFRHSVSDNVPEVELTFDLGDTRWIIRKRFALQSGKAWLTSSNSHRFEDEAAETQLQKLFEIGSRRGGAESGIWGTLWVSQGHSFGDPRLSDAGRSTLQGCIEAQVGLITGGDRGRKIPIAVDEALRELMSSKGPSGKYKDALFQFEKTKAQANQLEEKRNQLSERMESLTRQKRERKTLQANWNEDDHMRELDDLRKLRAAAAIKAHEIDAARNKAITALERAQRERQAVVDRAKLVRELETIENSIRVLANEMNQTSIEVSRGKSRVETCQKTLTDLYDTLRVNGEQGRRFDRIRTCIAYQVEIEGHMETLRKAAELQTESGRLSELIGQIAATDDSTSRIAAAETDLAGAKAALQAVATTVDITLDTGALRLVQVDGAPVVTALTSRSVVAKTKIEIVGIGEVMIEPQIRERDEMLTRLRLAEDEMQSALEAAGAKDIGAARIALAQRREYERQLADTRREITGLAPKDKSAKLDAGPESRDTRIRQLQGRLKTEFESLAISILPSIEEIERSNSDTYKSTENLNTEITIAETAAQGPKDVLSEATTKLHALEGRLAGLRGNSETTKATLMAGRDHCSDEQLAVNASELERRAVEAQNSLKALETSQGDTVAATDARIKRLEAAGKVHHAALARFDTEIAKFSTWIEANEGTGVDEELEIARAEQGRLEATVKSFEEEVRVLQLLQEILRDSESEAKTQYLEPVLNLVEPYLKMLLPGARLMLDEDLGIRAVKRNGTDETFEQLSDGTQEQLAILTRLAFAELLLAKGRPATVILDDAMVFSDDDRIERMFDILTRAGEKVQILVLTCRKKLFTKFGAEELSLREIPL